VSRVRSSTVGGGKTFRSPRLLLARTELAFRL
jgi:hypothetical protein